MISTIPASVVRSIAEADAAFCALLVTFAGSTIPASDHVDIFFGRRVQTNAYVFALHFSDNHDALSRPAFSAIWRTSSSNALAMIAAPVFTSPASVST